MICNTVQQEGVPAAWFKWNLFPFSLEDEAQRWYTLASVEAKGNWDELVKKFLLKFFPISKVQDLRRQVLTFKQGECRAYSPGTHARKDEDGLLLELPCNPTRTCTV
jgi:hypothetical protein